VKLVKALRLILLFVFLVTVGLPSEVRRGFAVNPDDLAFHLGVYSWDLQVLPPSSSYEKLHISVYEVKEAFSAKTVERRLGTIDVKAITPVTPVRILCSKLRTTIHTEGRGATGEGFGGLENAGVSFWAPSKPISTGSYVLMRTTVDDGREKAKYRLELRLAAVVIK
jgi:hypothetical protein